MSNTVNSRRKTSSNSALEASVAHVKRENVVGYVWLVLDSSGAMVEASHDKRLLPECGQGEQVVKVGVSITLWQNKEKLKLRLLYKPSQPTKSATLTRRRMKSAKSSKRGA